MKFFTEPTTTSLFVMTVLLIVPFMWPFTMYVWLRALTGHRRTKGHPLMPTSKEPVLWDRPSN